MIHRYFRYAVLGLRLLFPTPAEARYICAIETSGLFDRDWYLACNPRLPRLCRWLPERHYVLVGEAVGLCPSPGFSPRAYRHLNPDLPAEVAPFSHYIATGHAAGRKAHDLPAGEAAPALPSIDPQDRPAPPAPVAVVLHLYYHEMWDEIALRLHSQTFAFDLFVTLPDRPGQEAAAAKVRAHILAAYPQARIWSFPNHGRDILPFLHLLHAGLFAPYDAVCKLHSKKSPHRGDGDQWRKELLSGVLGEPAQTAARLRRFLADPQAGLWMADGQRIVGADWWGPNRARAQTLLAKVGLPAQSLLPELVFAAGSIYWIKPAALAALKALPVSAADFEPEMGQVDGTTAHALERAFGLILTSAGLVLRQASELDHDPGFDTTGPQAREEAAPKGQRH